MFSAGGHRQARLQPRNFRIIGMDCAEEVAILKRELGPLVGREERLSFDVLHGRLTVSAEASDVSTQQLTEAVNRTGMRAEPWKPGSEVSMPQGFWQRYARTLLTGLSGVAIIVAVGLHAWLTNNMLAAFGAGAYGAPWAVRLFYGLAIVAGAWFVAPKAWYALRQLRPDMNLLMLVAVTGAVAIGEWFEAATVAFLFSLALLLESWSVGRARRAVVALLDLTPITVRLRTDDGAETAVSPKDVNIGATFAVRPGERIPLDGEIAQGSSHVNQAPITGESQPVGKLPGDTVFAGTINGDGALVVRSTKLAENTTLASIIRLVGEAHSRKAPSEQWVEKFARVYTPAVMVTALSVLLIPPLLFGGNWEYWFYNALVLLVIACPCALVISTPVSIAAALAAAARQGVLVKGGAFIEAPARLRVVAFDKTGTLTTGKPAVVEVVPLAGHDESELLTRAASMEAHSEHPVGKAIVEYATVRGITPPPADDFQVIQGKGAEAIINSRRFWLGSHRLLRERGQENPEIRDRLDQMSGTGRTIVIVGNDEHVCGLIALADGIRPMCQAVLQELREAGIGHFIMLTGDNSPTALAIAERIGVDEVRAELLPEDKIAVMDTLVEKYAAVAMVGDGVNDAPALARATLGIAMGAAGTDAAIETADVALMTDDLSRLPWLVRHSRRTLAIIRQNVVFSLAVKAVFVGLTFSGMASLWAAVAADMGASLLVVFNGMRLLGTAGSHPIRQVRGLSAFHIREI